MKRPMSSDDNETIAALRAEASSWAPSAVIHIGAHKILALFDAHQRLEVRLAVIEALAVRIHRMVGRGDKGSAEENLTCAAPRLQRKARLRSSRKARSGETVILLGVTSCGSCERFQLR